MELLVACVIAYYLVRHGPELLVEALAEAEYARQGLTSPAAAARAQRLRDAGIDPVAGGAARQFFGNAWRDTWLDLDEQRRRRRAERQSSGANPSGWADRLDEAITAAAARWRARSGGETPGAEPAAGTPGPAAHDAPGPEPRSEEPDPGPEPADTAEPEDVPEPVRVPSTQGEPIRDEPPNNPQPATEGNTMAGTAVVHVTGVASAAAEARAIERQLDAATAAYQAALAAVRRRAIALGNSTIADIQQALGSHTVAAIMAACEAIAAAEAHAAQTNAEAGPAMGRVARAFDRIAV